MENQGEASDSSELSVELNLDTKEHFLDRLENQGETPDASEHNVELNFDTEGVSLSDLMEDLGEALSPVGVDTLSQTGQPASQAPTTQNPFHHTPPALPRTSPLPTEQQEITDPNGQHTSEKIKRTSRHPKYQPALSSPQTDEECESSDNEVSKKAKNRLRKRKSQQLKADSLGIPVTELERQQKKALAERRGLNTTTELCREQRRAQAERWGFNTAAELCREQKRALAERMGLTVPQLKKKYKERAALKKAQKAQLESQNR